MNFSLPKRFIAICYFALLTACAVSPVEIVNEQENSNGENRMPAAVASSSANCAAPREEINVPHHGYYHRIHPSGDYFLFTDHDRSVVVDVSNRTSPKVSKTVMREETYPVESSKGGWTLLASPVAGGGRGTHGGTDYFSFSQIMQKPNDAKASYTDPRFGQYYHSSAELPGSTDAEKKVRTLLYENRLYRDYTMKMGADGKVESATASADKSVCNNIFTAPVVTEEKHRQYNRLMREAALIEDRLYREALRAADKAKLRAEMSEKRFEAAKLMYGARYAQLVPLREKVEIEYDKAREAYENMPAMRDAVKKQYEAEGKMIQAREAARRSPAVLALRLQMQNIDNDYRSANSENRRILDLRYNELDREAQRLIGTLTENSDAYKAASAELKNQTAKIEQLSKTPMGVAVKTKLAAFEKINEEMLELSNGRELANPVLSKDGTHVAGLVGEKVQVFKIEANGNCTVVAKTDFRTSKVSFSYPAEGKPLQITFTSEALKDGRPIVGAYVYDLSSKKATMISGPNDHETYYPGFTIDGRVMYKNGSKMVIVDPLQAAKTGCIAATAVAAARRTSKPASTAR